MTFSLKVSIRPYDNFFINEIFEDENYFPTLVSSLRAHWCVYYFFTTNGSDFTAGASSTLVITSVSRYRRVFRKKIVEGLRAYFSIGIIKCDFLVFILSFLAFALWINSCFNVFWVPWVFGRGYFLSEILIAHLLCIVKRH